MTLKIWDTHNPGISKSGKLKIMIVENDFLPPPSLPETMRLRRSYRTSKIYLSPHIGSFALISSSTPVFILWSRRQQPRLGIGHHHTPYLFEDDPGIMSEVETSSTRFRRPSGNSAASGVGASGKGNRSSHSRDGHSSSAGTQSFKRIVLKSQLCRAEI